MASLVITEPEAIAASESSMSLELITGEAVDSTWG